MTQQVDKKDIKLYASEKLNDAPDGGGRVTANEIVSGQVNNVFQDISRVDHANGSAELRKVFVGIRTDNNAPLLGAHAIVSDIPEDENVNVLIFQTAKDLREVDVRTNARDYLENYYIKSAREFVQPLGLNVELSTTLTLFAADVVPVDIKAGDTIVLVNSETQIEEYVKIQSMSVARQSFIYYESSGSGGSYHSFTAKAIRCQLVSPLMNSWDGGAAKPNGVENTKLSVFSTAITNAARYRGATHLTTQLDAGETLVSVKNVLQPLVPVARQEQALVNRNPYSDIAPVIRGCDEGETPLQIIVTPTEESGVLYMPTPVTRASMTAETAASTWMENGSGELSQNGALSATMTVDYASGIVTYSGLKNTQITFRYLPAASAGIPAITTGVEITQANLGLVYTFDLSDLPPEPSTLHIAYMAAGDWLEMADNGQGSIAGQGIGTVDYSTGQIQVTLEREPELTSYILISYLPARSLIFDRPSGSNQTTDLKYDREIAFGKIIKPGTLTITDAANTKTSTDDGNGNFSGTAGEGTVDYASGKVTLSPATASFETQYSLTADTSDAGKISALYPATVSGDTDVALSVGQTIMPGTLRINLVVRDRVKRTAFLTLYKQKTESISAERHIVLFDDGAGNVYGNSGLFTGGTINYTTGAITLPGLLRQSSYQNIETVGSSPSKVQYQEYQTIDGNQATVNCLFDAGGYASLTKTLSIEAAKIQITDIDKYEPIIPNSLWLKINGVDYFDDGNGKIISGYSALTRAGTQVGNIDYSNGVLSIQNVSATAATVQVKSLVTLKQGLTSEQLIFAIKDRPLRHSSFQMNIVTVDGTVRKYTADENGVIKVTGGGQTVGSINVNTGVVIINAAGLGGSVESRASVLGSLRYNAVKSESLPVDPDIVGLNVQRLPIDGRVPIFKLGDTLVLNHSATQSIGTPTAGQTITLDRDHLASVEVLCDDKALDPAQYEINLTAGVVTFKTPLILQTADETPLAGTWTIKHRIEHMTLVTRVQQSGMLTMQVPSAHVFPAGAVASSALLFGDLQADVLNIYTQKTWQNNAPNWTDQPDSSGETTARYDTINYPIAVSNKSAVTDKWALVFKSANTVDVVSENLGVIVSNAPIGSQIAPINPVTGTPYFVISQLGWGSGWVTSNVMRFNTKSALAPLWIARTVTPAQGITDSDRFVLSPRGDSQ